MESAPKNRDPFVGTLVHDLLGIWMLAWSYAPAIAALWAFHRWPSPLTFVLAFVMVSVRMNAIFVVVHESWHFNQFRSRKVNEWLGAALASYPIMMPYFQDRNTHWNHHRFVGTKRDPDAWAWDWSDERRGGFIREFFFVASGLSYALRIARLVLRIPAPQASDGPPRPTLGGKMALMEISRLALVHAGILAIFWKTIGWYWYFPLWLYPGISLFPAFGMLREFLEHRRGALIVYEAGPLERFFFGCFNFHLHAYHHAYAAAPWFTLGSMRERALKKTPNVVFLKSYVREFVHYLRGTSTVPFGAGAISDDETLPAGDTPLGQREAGEAA